MTAYKWGLKHGSDDLEERLAFDRAHPDAGQAGYYLACQRGDHVVEQLDVFELPPATKAALDRVIEKFIGRAIERLALHCEVPDVERWAAVWLSGEDRSSAAAWEAVEAADAAAEASCAAGTPVWAARATALAAATKWAARSARLVALASADAAAADAAAATTTKWEAEKARYAAVEPAWGNELARIADELRAEIPVWPGEAGVELCTG